MQEILTKGLDPQTGKVIEQLMPAECFGLLGVHPSWSSDSFTVTHVPTGCTVCTLGDYDAAVEIARYMSGCDWDFEDRLRVPAPLRVEVTTYLREMQRKHADLRSNSCDIKPEAHPRGL